MIRHKGNSSITWLTNHLVVLPKYFDNFVKLTGIMVRLMQLIDTK